MVNKQSPPIKLNIAGIGLLACLILTTLGLGIYGFSSVYVAKPNISYPELTKWLDVCYSTLKLFSMISSPVEEDIKHWAVSGARLSAACSVFFTIAFATFLAAGSWIKANILIRYYKNHYVVFGLNNESAFLIDDLLVSNKKVVIVESDPNNPLATSYSKKRATLILADGADISVQLKASILNASTVITMTGCDLKNLEILKTMVESPYAPDLNWHIGLDNVMSYKLFEPGAFYSIESIKKQSTGLLISVFNLNELASIELVQSMGLGSNANTIDADGLPVNILIQGFNDIGQAVLRELLLIAHFSNLKKVHITILNAQAHDFFTTHHQVLNHANGNGLDLWDIRFIETREEVGSPKKYNHIIVCEEDENVALKNILWLYDLCTTNEMQETDRSTTFHYYNALDHDIEHQQITSFGALKRVSSYSLLVKGQSESLAKRGHEIYAKSELQLTDTKLDQISDILMAHDQQTSDSNKWLHWINQPLYKRRSNFTEKRHVIIKTLALGNISPCNESNDQPGSVSFLPFINEFADLDMSIIANWINAIKEKMALSEAQLIVRMNQLAKAEHNRWNAFHIVNNWRYGKQKNEHLKTHDCLLSWHELELLRPDTIKYDYKNVYQLAELLCKDRA